MSRTTIGPRLTFLILSGVLVFNLVNGGWGAKLDAVGWHSGGMDAAYVATVKDFKKKCAALGFNGEYYCTEIGGGGGLYPPGMSKYPSEMARAKQVARSLNNKFSQHSGADCTRIRVEIVIET